MGKQCESPICERQATRKGMCNGHYRRWMQTGNAQLDVPIAARPPFPETLEEAFWSHVQKGQGCWEWQGHRNALGYGVLTFKGRKLLAHRVSWELTNGEALGERKACHRCDNPPCVNPADLYAGSQADNIADMRGKRRHPCDRGETSHMRRGGDAPWSTLDVGKAQELLALYEAGATQRELSQRFNVSKGTVSNVVKGRHWAVQGIERWARQTGRLKDKGEQA